jgi:hypothetical protein
LIKQRISTVGRLLASCVCFTLGVLGSFRIASVAAIDMTGVIGSAWRAS